MNTVFKMATSLSGSLKAEHDANFARLFLLFGNTCSVANFPNTCSVANFPSGVLGTRVKPDTCRIRVDGQIRFDHGYV